MTNTITDSSQEIISVTLTKSQWQDIDKLLERSHDELAHFLSLKEIEEYDEDEVDELERLQEGDAHAALLNTINPVKRLKLTGLMLDNDERDIITLILDVPRCLEDDELESYIDNRIAEETSYCHMGYSMEELA